MPEITLTEDQVEYLEDLREHIAEEHVGPYGHVRMREAVQFLIDRYEADDESRREAVRRAVTEQFADHTYQELQSLAADTEGVEPGGTEEELRDRLVEARVDELLSEGGLDDANRSSGSESPANEAGMSEATSGDGRDERPSGDGDADDEPALGGTSDESGSADDSGNGGESRLERMMGLLDRHDDAWEETNSEQGKYAVTLPDGTVENVRTKDDVRSLLFKHYD